MTKLPSSLRYQFALGSIVFLLILFGLLSYNTTRIMNQLALANTRAMIAQTSETLNLALVPYTNAEELSTLNDYLDGLITGSEFGIVYLAILDEQNQKLVSTKTTPEAIPAAQGSLAQQLANSSTVHVRQNILLANNAVGQLCFGLSTQLLQETSHQLLQDNLILILLGLLASTLILGYSGGRVGNQLKQLIAASQSLAAGNHAERAPETGHNELSYLAHNFNLMADAVSERNTALQDSETKLKATINNPSLLIGLLDDAGRIRLANDAILAMDPRKEAITGAPFWSLSAFQHDTKQVEHLKKTIQDGLAGQVSQFMLTYQIDESIRYAEFSMQPLIDSTNQITGLVAQAIDITDRKLMEDRLAQANSEWREAMDQFEDPIYLVDLNQNLIRANQPFYDLIGSNAAAITGKPVNSMFHQHQPNTSCKVCDARNKLEDAVITMEADDPGNEFGRPFEFRLKLIRNRLGQPNSMLVSMYDLSNIRKEAERERLSLSVFENTAECIFITDIDGRVVDVNRSFTHMLGYTRDQVIGQSPTLWKSGRHDESFFRNLWQSLLTTGEWQGEIWNRRKDGTVFPALGTISRVTDDKGNPTHYVSVFTDVSQIKQSQDNLNHLAHHDALTDLPNRLLLHERLKQAIRHAERQAKQLAIVFLDLDNFKTINDSMGHSAGDELLQQVATRLLDSVRKDDTVARVGGDEFVLLLEDIKPDHVINVIEKIIATFQSAYRLNDREIIVTTSIGAALYPRDGENPDVLMRNADAALYRAKEEGRNTYQFYTEEMTRNAFERVLLENSLRQAVERDEFRLLFQPQIDIKTTRIIGSEALIRWEHPEFGMVSPVRFIPLAEETGLIHQIGKWVLLTACIQAKNWLDRNIPFGRISVNIAGPQIKRGDLVDDVMHALNVTQLPAQHLELEVTEGFIMEDPPFAITQLHELRKLGVYLSIDDFGTGYSSLSYLKQLPIHKLKIDQSFMRGIPDDPDDVAICHAIIAMSHSLGLSAIAEGVEVAEQANFLIEAGCFEAQGYYYSKPVSPDQLELLLNDASLMKHQALPTLY